MFFAAGTAGPGIRKVPISPHDLCDSGVTLGAGHGAPWSRIRPGCVRRRVLAFVASLHTTTTPPAVAAAAATCLAVAVLVCCFAPPPPPPPLPPEKGHARNRAKL